MWRSLNEYATKIERHAEFASYARQWKGRAYALPKDEKPEEELS